jgi:hypothetical protein
MMALGVALVTVGTLIGQRTAGPTDSATHLYINILAPTGFGKDHPLQCGMTLMESVSGQALLGPTSWASGPGFMWALAAKPLMVCFMDEFGEQLSYITNQKNNGCVTELVPDLKKCWNAFATITTAAKVNADVEVIKWPSPSVVGISTPEVFFEALTSRDRESGFMNRELVLPFEHHTHPPVQIVPAEMKVHRRS